MDSSFRTVMSLSERKDEINKWRTDHAELTTDKVAIIQEYCEEVNRVSKEIKEVPSKDVLLVQSEVVEEVLSYYKEALPGLQSNFSDFFNCERFLNKLKAKILSQGHESLFVPGVLRPCVSFQPLGLQPDLPVEEAPKSQPEKQRNAPLPKEIMAQASQPSKVAIVEKKDKQGAQMAHVFKALKSYFSQTSKPVEYFSFVLDPSSFSATITNIFIVSLLLQDHLVKMDITDDGEKYLCPLDQGTSKSLSNKPKNQIIISLSPPKYKELLKKLKIKEAKIPTWNQNA